MSPQKDKKGVVLHKQRTNRNSVRRKKNIDAQNDVLTEENHQKLLSIMKNSLSDMIDYLKDCSSESFYWISELFEDLSEHFKSQELIECMEKNAIRTGVNCSIDIEYAKKVLA